MVLDPIPQSLPVHFLGLDPSPPPLLTGGNEHADKEYQPANRALKRFAAHIWMSCGAYVIASQSWRWAYRGRQPISASNWVLGRVITHMWIRMASTGMGHGAQMIASQQELQRFLSSFFSLRLSARRENLKCAQRTFEVDGCMLLDEQELGDEIWQRCCITTHVVQGGEDAQHALSCRSLSAKEPYNNREKTTNYRALWRKINFKDRTSSSPCSNGAVLPHTMARWGRILPRIKV